MAGFSISIALQMMVSALKEELSGITSIPAERQRLIYKGRVVRDDQSLSDLGKPIDRAIENSLAAAR
jgi:ubiquilin